jgi:predicted ArsR family transcriptional regulator
VGSEELEGLRRADSQREVYLCLVENDEPMTSQDIAGKLGLTVNAVNIALFNLNNKELVERVSRGVYRYKMGPILKELLVRYFEV